MKGVSEEGRGGETEAAVTLAQGAKAGLAHALVNFLDVSEEFISAHSRFRTRHEVLWQFLPLLFERVKERVDILFQFASFVLIRLSEDNAERHAMLAQPLNELQINFLWCQSGVNQYKQTRQLFALKDIFFNDVLKLFGCFFASLSIAISREVHQVPFFINQEMVDKHRLARHRRRHRQFLAPRKHVNQTAFANIASTNKGIFR